jgi:hypothetical protein
MPGPYVVPVTPETALILERLDHLEGILMATQAQIDAIAARLTQATADIRADIEALKAANPELDLSSLEGKVANLEGLAQENPPSMP